MRKQGRKSGAKDENIFLWSYI